MAARILPQADSTERPRDHATVARRAHGRVASVARCGRPGSRRKDAGRRRRFERSIDAFRTASESVPSNPRDGSVASIRRPSRETRRRLPGSPLNALITIRFGGAEGAPFFLETFVPTSMRRAPNAEDGTRAPSDARVLASVSFFFFGPLRWTKEGSPVGHRGSQTHPPHPDPGVRHRGTRRERPGTDARRRTLRVQTHAPGRDALGAASRSGMDRARRTRHERVCSTRIRGARERRETRSIEERDGRGDQPQERRRAKKGEGIIPCIRTNAILPPPRGMLFAARPPSSPPGT